MPFIEEDTTPVTESPEQGHEEETAVEFEEGEDHGTVHESESAETKTSEEVETDHDDPEQGDPSPEQGHEESEEGELLAGKYKSQDDLVKAYKELERKFHESRQQPPAKTQQTTGDADEDPNEVVARAFAEDPMGTIQYFVERAMQPVQEQREAETLTKNMESITKAYGKQLSSEDGMNAYFEKIGELAKELGNPALVKNPPTRVLKMAAEELWGTESRQSVYNKAKAKGREEAENTRQSKKGLNAPNQTKKQETPKSAADQIKESIMNAGGGGLFGD